MKLRYLALPVLVFGFAAGAQARGVPTPPPSGIVIHLFGPDSVMSRLVPDLPGEHPNPAPGTGAEASATPATPAADASEAEAQPGPTVGEVLHRLFVTGDPNDPVQPSKGRAGERPAS